MRRSNQRHLSLFWLIASLFVMASAALAQEKLPDLTPVVVDANQGYVEVRNIGNAVSEPSQLYVVCSALYSGKSSPCAAGLHLPGYIEKWNTLPFDIPALKPGGSYRVQMFGAGAFSQKPGNYYGMKITSDPLKKIAESNETNNYTRLDTTPDRGPQKVVSREERSGQLQLTVMMDGKPIKAAIVLTRPGQMSYEMPIIQRRERMKQTPFESSWPVGKYDLHIHSEVSVPVNIYMQSKAIPIEIKKGQLLKKSITIPSGRLQLGATVEGEVTSGIEVKLSTLQGVYKSFYGLGLLTAPLDVSLPAGQYKLEAKSVEQKQSRFANVEVKAGSTIKKSLNFDKLRVGFLKLNILMNGKPTPFEYGFNMPSSDLLSDVHLSSSETGEPFVPLEPVSNKPIKLREGVYDLKVHERTVGGKDVEVKGITIREGETVEKTVELRRPGTLNIKARWVGQPYNIVACAAYHNPLNPQRLGALMGGSGGAYRGDCLDPYVHMSASVSSPGRSDGNIAKLVHLGLSMNMSSDEKENNGIYVQALDIEPGVYDLEVWPVAQGGHIVKGDHRKLKQTLKGVEITSGGITERKLKFRWPGKK